MFGGFQASAFAEAFQRALTVVTGWMGGPKDKRKKRRLANEETQAEHDSRVRRDRERLGILPPEVAEIVEAVAKQAEPDKPDRDYAAELRTQLRAAEIKYQAMYREILLDLVRAELDEQQEDEELALLLM